MSVLYLLDNLEKCLNEGFDSKLKWKLKFRKISKDHSHGDYVCHIPPSVNPASLTCDALWGSVQLSAPWMKSLMEFQVKPDLIVVRLARGEVFRLGLKCVFDLGTSYGCNQSFEGKCFNLDQELIETDSSSLTDLRVNFVLQVLSSLLKASSCDLVQEGCETIIVSSKVHKFSLLSHVLVGPVVTKKMESNNFLNTEEYKKRRLKEINAMCEHKLDSNDHLDNTAELLKCVITFDMLHTAIHRPTVIVLDGDSSAGNHSKGSLFVLYNYVRLVALCVKFDYLVSVGTYPPLIALDDVDFSLLTKDDEWTLMFDYILQWPEIVKKSLEDFPNSKPKIHIILCFLTSLASSFSLYYHHTRILTEFRNHLLKSLYAKIYLLKALLQVFANAFNILSLKPPSRM